MLTMAASAQQAPIGYDDTPMQPNGKWRVHDGKRPYPPLVTSMIADSAAAPSDAIVLLGPADNLDAWQMPDGAPASWVMKGGVLQTGKGMLRTKEQFTDVQLHVEFATPAEVKGDSQGRGNSGVFLLGHFEIQVLDSYRNITYPDGQAASMYGQYPPLVNVARAPGQWQTYDIIFNGPALQHGREARELRPLSPFSTTGSSCITRRRSGARPAIAASCLTPPRWQAVPSRFRITETRFVTGISGFGG